MSGRLYFVLGGSAELVRGADVDSDGDEVFSVDRITHRNHRRLMKGVDKRAKKMVRVMYSPGDIQDLSID